MPSRKRPHLELTTSPAPVQAASAMNEYINTQLTPTEQAHPAHALAPPEPAASANSRRRLGPGPASPAPPARRGLNQLSLDELSGIAQFLPLHDMASLARVSRQTAHIPIERVAQAVSPLRGVSLTLRECYARVKPKNDTLLKKSWIETEEQSLKALNMEHGGARHFFQANDMLQYVLKNWFTHHADEVVIVIPNLRQRISNDNGPWRRALARAGYPVSGTPAVVESVIGTENYRKQANLLEFRVGFYESDQVISMSAAHFVGTIAAQEATLQRRGTGYFECGLHFDGLHVPIRISFKWSDFFSVMYQKNVLEILDYQETLNKFRRRD
jgi:hypothetical protein